MPVLLLWPAIKPGDDLLSISIPKDTSRTLGWSTQNIVLHILPLTRVSCTCFVQKRVLKQFLCRVQTREVDAP